MGAVALFFGFTAAAQMAEPGHYVTSRVYLTQFEVFSDMTFTVTQQADNVTGQRTTRIEGGFRGPVDDQSFRRASLEGCLVPNSSVRTNTNSAFLNVMIPDVESACEYVLLETCTWLDPGHEESSCQSGQALFQWR